jgi:hypothetical protein
MIERFPMRHSAVVWLLREASGAWLVLARDADGFMATTVARSLTPNGWRAISDCRSASGKLQHETECCRL